MKILNLENLDFENARMAFAQGIISLERYLELKAKFEIEERKRMEKMLADIDEQAEIAVQQIIEAAGKKAA